MTSLYDLFILFLKYISTVSSEPFCGIWTDTSNKESDRTGNKKPTTWTRDNEKIPN